jgi:uncharacterized protein
MKRKILSEDQIKTLASALVGRAKLASRLGIQFGGKRDIYKSFGYDLEVDFEDFMLKYSRHDMAKAIIDRPVKATWQGPLDLMEAGIAKDTEFERAWDALNTNLGLKSKFARVDKLTGLGRYGILLLGLDDVKTREGFAQPVKPGKRILKYLRPYGEKTAEISSLDEDTTSERYGKPVLYKLSIQDVRQKSPIPIPVHHTRVIHITDDLLESEVFGTPRLESVFNRLIDLEKLVGGDAEMFWRGARPGYEAKINPDYQMTQQMREDLMDELDEYEADLRRFLVNEGVDIQALAQQIADPANHVDIQLTMISAETGIPKRILSGSERGELSSAQDSTEWKEYVQARREEFAEPNIIRPLVRRLIELEVLPKLQSDSYTVKWNDLYSLSEKARVEVGKSRANALREYTYSPMSQALIPPNAFNELFLGFNKEQITLITAMRDEVISEEELNAKVIKAIENEVNPPKPVMAPGANPTKPKPKSKPTK